MPARRPRRARIQLDPDEVVRTAIEIADRDGLEALSMRRLGAELDVDPMALYRCFDGKAALQEAMADVVLDGAAPPAEPAADWRERSRAGARALREQLLRHPGVAPLVIRRPPFGPNSFRATELALRGLVEAGFDDDLAPMVFQGIVVYTLGYVTLELGMRAGGESRAVTEAYQSLPPEEYPHTARLADHVFVRDATRQFELGLDALLDGFEQRRAAG